MEPRPGTLYGGHTGDPQHTGNRRVSKASRRRKSPLPSASDLQPELFRWVRSSGFLPSSGRRRSYRGELPDCGNEEIGRRTSWANPLLGAGPPAASVRVQRHCRDGFKLSNGQSLSWEQCLGVSSPSERTNKRAGIMHASIATSTLRNDSGCRTKPGRNTGDGMEGLRRRSLLPSLMPVPPS